MAKMPDIMPGDMILVRKGLDAKFPFIGPFSVLKTAKQQGILKTVYYQGLRGKREEAWIGNVLPYHPRRDEDRRLGGYNVLQT